MAVNAKTISRQRRKADTAYTGDRLCLRLALRLFGARTPNRLATRTRLAGTVAQHRPVRVAPRQVLGYRLQGDRARLVPVSAIHLAIPGAVRGPRRRPVR